MCSAPMEQKGLFEVGGRVPTICAVLLWSRRDCLRLVAEYLLYVQCSYRTEGTV